MDIGQLLIIALSILLGVGYLLGLMANRRRGIQLYHRLRSGAEAVFGKLSGARWIGSAASGAQLTIAQAHAPFRRVEMAFLLETRELWPLWLVQRLRGRRDELILKATLRTPPAGAWELVPSRKQATYQEQGFETVLDLAGKVLLHKGPSRPEETALPDLIRRYGNALQGFSLRREQPHLILRVHLAPLGEDLGAFFQALQQTFTSQG